MCHNLDGTGHRHLEAGDFITRERAFNLTVDPPEIICFEATLTPCAIAMQVLMRAGVSGFEAWDAVKEYLVELHRLYHEPMTFSAWTLELRLPKLITDLIHEQDRVHDY